MRIAFSRGIGRCETSFVKPDQYRHESPGAQTAWHGWRANSPARVRSCRCCAAGIILPHGLERQTHAHIRILGTDLRSGPVAVLFNCNQHLKKNPGHVTAYIRRGLSLLLLDRDQAAEDDFDEIYRQLPEVRPPGVFHHLIDEAKRYREASPILVDATAESPPGS